MDDDLNIFVNGRQPHFLNGRRPQQNNANKNNFKVKTIIFLKMEDDLIFF